MGLLADLTPLNALAEKDKFWANPKSNPVFQYVRTFRPGELYDWGLPKVTVAEYCLSQLKKDSLQEPGTYIDQQVISQAITHFNEVYQLKKPLQIQFSEHFATKVKVSSDCIYFKLPIRYTSQTFQGLCRHELETHVLRRMNHVTNFGTEVVSPELKLRRTEEGLANLHSHLFRADKTIKKTYLSYYSVYLAQHYSFADMFQILLDLRMSRERAWNLCLRNKRGLEDTSELGGFTKDICYLEGTIQVWDWLINRQQPAQNLYLGRLDLDTIDRLTASEKTYQIITPKFYEDQVTYLKMITEIGEVNKFTELKGLI